MRRPTDPRQQALFDGIELATNAKNWKDRTLVGYEPAIETGVYDDPEGDGNVWERWDEHLAQRYPTDPDTSHLFIDAMEIPLADLPKRVEEGGDDAVEPARPPQKERLFNMSTGLPTSAPRFQGWGQRAKKDEYLINDREFTTSDGYYDLVDEPSIADGRPHEDEFKRLQRSVRDDPGAWFDSDAEMAAADLMRPHLQGALFGRDVGTMSSQDPSSVNRQLRWESANTIASGRNGIDATVRKPERHADVAKALYNSGVPYGDMKRAQESGLKTYAYMSDAPDADDTAGSYLTSSHTIAFPDHEAPSENTVVHELGHALHIQGDARRIRGHTNIKSSYKGDSDVVQFSPTLEGVADGYAERYASMAPGKPVSANSGGSGYPRLVTLPENATDGSGDRIDIGSTTGAMYAAMREHVSSTGQIPHISEYTKVSDFRNVQGEQFASLRKSAEADLSRRQGEQLELFPRREPLP